MTTWSDAKFSRGALAAKLRETFQEQCLANNVQVMFMTSQGGQLIGATPEQLSEIWQAMARHVAVGLGVPEEPEPPAVLPA